MKELEKEILEMIVSEMEMSNVRIIENEELTEEEKKELMFNVDEVKSNEKLREVCIEAMKKGLEEYILNSLKEKGLVEYALETLKTLSFDEAMDIEEEVFFDSVADVYSESYYDCIE